jgi:hypothetical protein
VEQLLNITNERQSYNIFIPKETWHRVIKGTGELKVKITKL